MSSLWQALSGMLLICTIAAADTPARPELEVVFHLPFDGSIEAASGGHVTITGGEDIRFVEGKIGQAADLRASGSVEYHNLPALDMQSGTIEFWINSTHDGRHMEDRFYLQFLRDDGQGGIEAKFYHVECSIQATIWGEAVTNRHYGWGWAQDAWQHIAFTWDTTDPELAGLKLYRNGVESGYPCSYKPVAPPDFLRVGYKSAAEPISASALIDEVVVYNRALFREQIKTLYEAGEQPLEQRLIAVRERISADEARKSYLTDQLFNHTRFGFIHGRYQSMANWSEKVFATLGLPVPEPIDETELATTDMGQYDVLLVGGGGGLRLDEANAEALRQYVRSGGGYVGICGGAISAASCGLIEAERYNFGARGPVWGIPREHPITEGYDIPQKILFPHASGPLFVIHEDSDEVPVVLFDVGNPPLPTFVNAIARQYGEGRVAVFSGHPEGSAETHRLLRNAIMWAAGIVAIEEQATAR